MLEPEPWSEPPPGWWTRGRAWWQTGPPVPVRYLVGNEEAIITVRHHFSQLGGVMAQTLGIVVVAAWMIGNLSPSGLTDLVALAMLAAGVRLAWHVLLWYRTTVTISNKRLFKVSGVFARRLHMLPMRKMTDMTLVQPLPGRLFGYGTIIVESAGQNQALSDIDHIPDPMRFYQTLVGLVFGVRADEEVEWGSRSRRERSGDPDATQAIDIRPAESPPDDRR